MKLDQTLDLLLVSLYKDVLEKEQRSLITKEYRDLSVNDMHVIEAIGPEKSNRSSVVARKLSITMGSLTKAMDGLSDKGYVLRERSAEDKRVVLLTLTDKGQRAYKHYRKFHTELVTAITEELSSDEQRILAKSLNKLAVYLKKQESVLT
ncbi:MAG: MarR family winged helix-turn-helix transcriptional regulator [Lachnospiraceae bacterium]|nr:MarR family winged helix-turn-helix transcriptional regulator [Lachnospiraceae bacterium]